MRDRRALTRELEGGGTWLKDGMARVDREGGLRSEAGRFAFLGPVGRPW